MLTFLLFNLLALAASQACSVANCMLCSSVAAQCTICNAGYVVNSNDICAKCNDNSEPCADKTPALNCAVDGTSCCAAGATTCLSCGSTTSQCTTCTIGRYLQSTGTVCRECFAGCPACSNQDIAAGTAAHCCPEYCATCTGTGATLECTGCFGGNALTGSGTSATCACATGYTDAKCTTCDTMNATRCMTCVTGYTPNTTTGVCEATTTTTSSGAKGVLPLLGSVLLLLK